jgi:hypothetical protein
MPHVDPGSAAHRYALRSIRGTLVERGNYAASWNVTPPIKKASPETS